MKSAALGPVTVIVEITRSAFPVLVNVTDICPLVVLTACGGNCTAVEESETAGPVPPGPFSVTMCGELLDESVRVKTAVRGPVPEGVNVKTIGQATCGL